MSPDTLFRPRISARVRVGTLLMWLAGAAQVLSGLHFLRQNFGEGFLERGITPAEVGVSKAEIGAFNQDLLQYISHLHINVAGLGIALGMAVIALAWIGVRSGMRWAWWTAVVTVAIAAGIGIPPHFTYGLATIGHLGPSVAILTVFTIGALASYPTRTSVMRGPGEI